MAYGRLEVYFPDGRLETFLLEKETVSVGRAEGNVVPLDTDTISRYHFSITHDNGIIHITDLGSQNGTYIEGVQLKSNEPFLLGDVEEIQVGSLRILFRSMDDTALLQMMGEEATQRIEREEANIRLDLDYTHLRVWPAASSSAELSIHNKNKEEKRFTVRVSGMPGEWLRVTRPELEIGAGETAYVMINIKPPRRPTTTPQDYQVTIEVAPIDQPELAIHALLFVSVREYRGFGIAAAPQTEAGDPVSVFLHNQGSSPTTVTLTAYDRAKALAVKHPNAPLQIQAGQRVRVDLEINARKPPLSGSPQTHKLFIQVKSHDAAAFTVATEAKVMVLPRIPFWGLVTVVGILLSVLAIGVVWGLGYLNPPEPIITTVSINAEQIAQGDTLIITLEAQDIELFDVLVNDVVTDTGLPGDQRNIMVDTTNLTGDVSIAIIGRNGNASTQVQTSAYVYVPVIVRSFVATPETLVRYTVQTLTLSWDVPGAQFVRISGLSTFTNQLMQGSTEYSSVQTLEGIGGIPEQPLEITLYAEDEIGTPLTQQITIPLIDPQCTAQIAITLFEGPDSRYQQVGVIPAENVVVVTAQDAGGGWLRVQLAGDIRGWGEKAGFVCANNFDPTTLRIESQIPALPTATTTPTQIPTATPTAPPTAGSLSGDDGKDDATATPNGQ